MGAALVALVGPSRNLGSVFEVTKRFEAPALMLSEAQCDLVFGEPSLEKNASKADDLRTVLHDIMAVGSRFSGVCLQSFVRNLSSSLIHLVFARPQLWSAAGGVSLNVCHYLVFCLQL